MTPDELYKAILRVLTQVRNVRAERYPDWNGRSLPLADDPLLDEMARNTAQALVILIDHAGGGPCPQCGESFVGAGGSGVACSLCGSPS
jgi:hypothetical protein